MSLLVVASALLMPSMQRWQRDIDLQQAVAAARGGLSQTRLAAIENARPHGFVFEHGGRRFGIVDDRSPINAAPLRFELPLETQFVGDASQAPQRESLAAPIWFKPDGTASDSVFWIQDATGSRQRLTVRRLTGGVSCQPEE